ncbi:hypothetical protein C8R43DRAFT_1238206 [Mycena crocata]|nr:hypothetical protein C8R43DRAFT_1238206 [Mycena crocata]
MWNLVQLFLDPLNSFVDSLLDDTSSIEAFKWLREYLAAHPPKSLEEAIVVYPEQRPTVALACVQILNGALTKPIAGTGFMENIIPPAIPKFLSNSDLPAEIWYACKFWIHHVSEVGLPDPSLAGALRRFLTKHLRTWIEIMLSRRQFMGLNGLRNLYQEDEDIQIALYSKTIALNLHKVALVLSNTDGIEWLTGTSSPNLYQEDEDIQIALYSKTIALNLHKVALVLSNTDRLGEALDVQSEAADIFRGLARRHPDRITVNNLLVVAALSRYLARDGHDADAVTAAREAIDIGHKLVVMEPPALAPLKFAHYISALSTNLVNAGILDVGVDLAQLSVDMCRKLSDDKESSEHLRVLVPCLGGLFIELVQSGRNTEALPFIREIVGIHKTKIQPPSFPNIIVPRYHQAQAVFEEVLGLQRSVVAANLTDRAANVQLSELLSVYASVVGGFGRRKEAAGLLEETLRILSNLVREEPSSEELQRLVVNARLSQLRHFLHDESTLHELDHISASLQATSDLLDVALVRVDCLGALERREERLAVAKESLTMWQTLPERRNKSNKSSTLVRCCKAVSEAASQVGQRDEALAAIEQAVDALKGDGAATFTQLDTAVVLDVYAQRLAAVGRNEEALVNVEAALRISKQLSAGQEEFIIFRNNIACSLASLSSRLSELGRKEEALAAIQQAVSLPRALIAGAEASDEFILSAVHALNNLVALLRDSGRVEEALPIVAEALEHIDRPNNSFCLLTKQEVRAESFNQLALCLYALGRFKDSIVESRKSVELYRGLAAAYSSAFDHLLATSLDTLCTCSNDAAAMREAVMLRRSLAEKWPAVFARELVKSVQRLEATVVTNGDAGRI